MFPTVELHRHFEAGLSPELVARLAEKNHVSDVRTRSGLPIDGVDPRDPDSIRRYYAKVASGLRGPGGFDRFLDSFGLPLSVLASLDDLRDAARQQVLDCAAAGSLHTELRGSPFTYRERIDASLVEIVRAIRDGIESAWSDAGASGSFIVSFSRQKGLGSLDSPPEKRQASAVAAALLATYDSEVPIGFDIAGAPEISHPPRKFAEALAPLREAGVPITVHAGEQGFPPDFVDAPPELVVEAVELLGARRIGHGTSLAASADARARLRERSIGVECCPESNHVLGFQPISDHPLRLFLDEGLLASVGTDDPLMFGSMTVAELLQTHSGLLRLGSQEHRRLAENGIATAFVSETRRTILRQRLENLAAKRASF